MTERQPQLTVMEDKRVPEVSSICDEYVDERDARLSHGKKEKALKDRLIASMNERKLKFYKDPETEATVTITTKQDVKVVHPKSKSNNEEETE